MKDANEEQLRELITWMGTLPGVEDEAVVRVRSWFCVAEFTPEDYRSLSSTLGAAGASAGFAFCARDVDRYGRAMADLVADGHELVFHGNRHTTFDDLSYETAYDSIETGLDRIEAACDTRPIGFFVPWMDASEGTLAAAADLGIEWLFANPASGASVPDAVTVTQPVMPPDSLRLEQGEAPAAMLEAFADEATDDASFLFHPPFLQYYDGFDAFEDWLETVQPVSVADHLDGEGPGLVLDAIQPLRLR